MCTSFPRPPSSNGGFRKGAQRDAVTDVAARGPGDEGLTGTRGARAGARRKKEGFWRDRGETATPDYIPLLGLEDPVRPFVLENDGERQQRTARNGESFLPTRLPCVEH